MQQRPPLYRDPETGFHHSTTKCPHISKGTILVERSHDDFRHQNYDRCEACVPIPIFVPQPGVTDRRVYHARVNCPSVPWALRRPELKYRWVWWPTWEYEHVVSSHGEYVRCTHCIPDRALLYPEGRKPRRRRTRLKPGATRGARRRKAA